MRKVKRISRSGFLVVVDKEDSFVSELARRIRAAWEQGGRTGRRSMYRREIADHLAVASFVRHFAESRPARRCRAGGPPPGVE
jgi:hypothetical protein